MIPYLLSAGGAKNAQSALASREYRLPRPTRSKFQASALAWASTSYAASGTLTGAGDLQVLSGFKMVCHGQSEQCHAGHRKVVNPGPGSTLMMPAARRRRPQTAQELSAGGGRRASAGGARVDVGLWASALGAIAGT